jgi:hypothetical protein
VNVAKEPPTTLNATSAPSTPRFHPESFIIIFLSWDPHWSPHLALARFLSSSRNHGRTAVATDAVRELAAIRRYGLSRTPAVRAPAAASLAGRAVTPAAAMPSAAISPNIIRRIVAGGGGVIVVIA